MLVNAKGLKKLSFAGGSASPFIDKRDSFTSERVRVRMLLGSVAHADGYKIMVGAYNTVDVTVECQMHMTGCVALSRNGRCWYLQILLMPRGI